MASRKDGRNADTLRAVRIEHGFQKNPEGSVLYRGGDTFVMISASVGEGAPDWMRGASSGWLTAEYAMHPRASRERQRNSARRGPADGRATEIQRLIGRALRSSIDLAKLGPRTITVDCDVLDADGGTRTASITGGMVATVMALEHVRKRGLVDRGVLRTLVAAVSVGLVNGVPTLDLDYVEDRDAEVDLNVVGTADGCVVEVQGTAEGAPMPRAKLDAMLDLALSAMPTLVAHQRAAIEAAGIDLGRLLA
ncbi:MAG: ribonuclease PH [Polyangiales bacterium]